MQRRDFIKRAITGAAGAAVGATSAAAVTACASDDKAGGAPAVHTAKRVRWRLASSFPPGLDTIYGGAETLKERVEAITGGRFQIQVYAAGELVPGLQVLDAVQQGSVQVGHTASYYYTGKNPALAFDTCVPFGLTAAQQRAWLQEGGGAELLAPLFADFGVRTFQAGNTGMQMVGWFQREIGSLADLKGLKMRIPGLGGQVMDRLGVTVQVLAGGDIFPALERGAIDATEWVGPYDDEKLGFYKVAKLYYSPGWWEPGPSLSFYVGEKAWSELPAEYQAAFRAAADTSALTMKARYDARKPLALRRLIGEGVQIKRFSQDILEGARVASDELMQEQAAADPAYRKIFEHWTKARDAMVAWDSAAALPYASFVGGGVK